MEFLFQENVMGKPGALTSAFSHGLIVEPALNGRADSQRAPYDE